MAGPGRQQEGPAHRQVIVFPRKLLRLQNPPPAVNPATPKLPTYPPRARGPPAHPQTDKRPRLPNHFRTCSGGSVVCGHMLKAGRLNVAIG